jgi:hypothetical protein
MPHFTQFSLDFRKLWTKFSEILGNNSGKYSHFLKETAKKRPLLSRTQLFARNVHNPLRVCVHSEFLARRRTQNSEEQNNVTLQNSEWEPLKGFSFLAKGRPRSHFGSFNVIFNGKHRNYSRNIIIFWHHSIILNKPNMNNSIKFKPNNA